MAAPGSTRRSVSAAIFYWPFNSNAKERGQARLPDLELTKLVRKAKVEKLSRLELPFSFKHLSGREVGLAPALS